MAGPKVEDRAGAKKNHKRDERGLRMESRREDEERSSRSKRDSRRDERADYEDQKWSGRDRRRERKRDEYENMEVDDEGRVIRRNDKRGSDREHRREERRGYGRDGVGDCQRELRKQGRSIQEKDEQAAGKDRRPNHKDSQVSENHGYAGRDGSGTASEERYNGAWLTSQIISKIRCRMRAGRFCNM